MSWQSHETEPAETSEASPLEVDVSVARALLDQVPDGLIVADEDGRIRLVNEGFTEMFGYAREQVIGRQVEELVPDDLRNRHRAHRLRFRTAPHRRPMGSGIELEGCRADGSTFPVEISLSPLTSDEGVLTIATIRDISERLSAQRTLSETRQRLALSEDRERIARDLHDKVIQRLFATGLGLQAAASRAESDSLRDRLRGAIDDLDEAIREIRSSIFALHAPASGEDPGLRARVIERTTDATRVLGFSPRIQFTGPVDTAATPEVTEALLATLQETLSNIVRHAHASAVSIEVTAADGIELVVRDDGVGLVPAAIVAGDGLRNMRDRAGELGGEVRIEPDAPKGTRVTWRVPIK